MNKIFKVILLLTCLPTHSIFFEGKPLTDLVTALESEWDNNGIEIYCRNERYGTSVQLEIEYNKSDLSRSTTSYEIVGGDRNVHRGSFTALSSDMKRGRYSQMTLIASEYGPVVSVSLHNANGEYSAYYQLTGAHPTAIVGNCTYKAIRRGDARLLE